MKKISDFFEKFKHITPPHGTLRNVIAHALGDIAHVTVSPEKISISHGVAYVYTSSIAKQTIRIHRGKILEYIFQELPRAKDELRDVC